MTNRDSSTPPEEAANIQSNDTVPPPESGDAYSAMTVVREAPPAVLEAIRKRKLEEAVKRADAAHEKKAAERAGEITVEVGSEKPTAPQSDNAPAIFATPAFKEERASLSPPASALVTPPLPRIEGYGVPGPANDDDDDDDDAGDPRAVAPDAAPDEEAPERISSLSIRPKVPAVAEAEHADPSILAIEPAPDGKALDMRSPFAPSPRRAAENMTLVIIAVIALVAGWVL